MTGRADADEIVRRGRGWTRETHVRGAGGAAAATLAALLGNFIITLDAIVVTIALPSIGRDLGGSVSSLQWVADAYTVTFAALLLSCGALSDRIGGRRAFAAGLILFTAASAACGLAGGIGLLVAARLVQGGAAAVMMPASLGMLGAAHVDARSRGRAVALWAAGGGLAGASAPVLGGLLAEIDWRWIFLVNVPVGLATLGALTKVKRSPVRSASFDVVGQATAVITMAGTTYGAISAGELGLEDGRVLFALLLAAVAALVFVLSQLRGRHPMIPRPLQRDRTVAVSLVIGFAFMVGFWGLPFVLSLFLQRARGLSPLTTGLTFLLMLVVGAVLTPLSARLVERVGYRRPIVAGLILLCLGLIGVAIVAPAAPLPTVAAAMMVVGLSGPLVMPTTTGALLNAVDPGFAGTASSVFHTSRQVGGALAIAIFGALLAGNADIARGMQVSLTIAAGTALAAACAATRLRASTPGQTVA